MYKAISAINIIVAVLVPEKDMPNPSIITEIPSINLFLKLVFNLRKKEYKTGTN